MIDIKSRSEIEIMKEGGSRLTEIAVCLRKTATKGISTMDLEERARELFAQYKIEPAFLDYGVPPFPATICTSINEEIVHGIPSKDKILEEGDIISIDLGGIWKGFYTDMAFTVGIGEISKEKKALIEKTKKALDLGMSKMYTSNKLYDISWAIQSVADEAGYGVVRDLVGHGIGRKLHEPPQIPNYGKKGTGMELKAGMVFALEPMFNEGTYDIRLLEDRWTVVTADGRMSSHYENTVAVTEDGPVKITDTV